MGFTVVHRGGMKDVEFEPYALLLHRRGVDLAKLPRVPEPGTGRRWLPVWDSKADARAFADELRKRTRDRAWEIAEVNGRPSEGPLGPVEIEVARKIDGWAFGLHPLSELTIQKVFPGSCRLAGVVIQTETPPDDKATQEEIPPLA